jgi:hypothetical protein
VCCRHARRPWREDSFAHSFLRFDERAAALFFLPFEEKTASHFFLPFKGRTEERMVVAARRRRIARGSTPRSATPSSP